MWGAIGVLGLAAVLALSPGVDGACVHDGALHADNSSWRPEPCVQCSCHGEVVLCSDTVCPNPQCDFQRGERLRIPANKCCPECISSQGSCLHEGLTYGDGSQWSPSPCSLCSCSGGGVSCSALSCPAPDCPEDHRLHRAEGECCPQCVRNGGSCRWEDREFRDGEQFQSGLCSRCLCSDGEVQCSVAECEPVSCKTNENLVIGPGQCCPKCMSNPCLSAGQQHQHGEQWQKDACTTCVCDRGASKCHSRPCPQLSCPKGHSAVRRPGQCCEECVLLKGSCHYEGTARYHGDMWNGTTATTTTLGSGCEFCTCDRGQVLCQRAECERLQCEQGSELLFEEGKCCPLCSTEKPGCTHHGNNYKAGSRWSEGDCRECECRGGHVTCYVRSCPTCTPGLLSVTKEGQCCPECQQVRCHPDCSSCSGRPDHCETCSDPKAVLHMGRCLDRCPPGSYQDRQLCRACAPSCLSCSGPSLCDSCGPQAALLSPDRLQCVSVCPSGSYQHDHSHCRECHSSCSECSGPSDSDCLSCSHLSALLKLGRCVSECGDGFYSQDHNCYACDPSCESCLPDDPLCASCPPGVALHRGKCISACPPQHYKDGHGRCRVCHSSCSSCWGPSVSQCSVCPPELFLLQGQCVETCGEGLYPQDQACHNCHPSCRSCVGPLASDCALCLKPEQVLVLQLPSSEHGVCAAKCPKFSYQDSAHVCRDCDSSCLQCSGPSADSCLSCPSVSSLRGGQCLSRCPQGSYSEEAVCQDCHPSCLSCSGASQADCTSCPPGASLHSGYCRTSCGEGQYLSSTTGGCASEFRPHLTLPHMHMIQTFTALLIHQFPVRADPSVKM